MSLTIVLCNPASDPCLDDEHLLHLAGGAPFTMKIEKRESRITCPSCGHVSTETMAADSCQFFYDCKGCGSTLRPKQGNCCVFCSYGDTACPPRQIESQDRPNGEECC